MRSTQASNHPPVVLRADYHREMKHLWFLYQFATSYWILCIVDLSNRLCFKVSAPPTETCQWAHYRPLSHDIAGSTKSSSTGVMRCCELSAPPLLQRQPLGATKISLPLSVNGEKDNFVFSTDLYVLRCTIRPRHNLLEFCYHIQV